jgi:transcriptional regulator with XRE-family HTH domain
MTQDEAMQISGTVADYLIQKLTDEQNGKEFATEYLKSSFLAAAVHDLFYARKQANLTQTQVAERLNTKQAAIARLEADSDGSMSLSRYVDFAMACGMIPLHITLAPVETVRQYVIAQPKGLGTQEDYNHWLKKTFQLNTALVEQPTHEKFNISSSATTLREARPSINIGSAQLQTFQLEQERSSAIATPEYPRQVSTLIRLPEKAA